MNPALSILLFTILAGAAQGLAVAIAIATLMEAAPLGSMPLMLGVAAGMLVLALIASFFHLGHPMRAWRAVLMWRTSWMSREVIALPAFIGVIAAWAVVSSLPGDHAMLSKVLACLTIAGAFLLWYCTAMIYACIRFIQEWAHPITAVNYILLGLTSGFVVAGALSMALGEQAFAGRLLPWAVAATAAAWIARAISLRRNRLLKPKSTTQSATGIRSAKVVQKSMGFTGGSFNTREFFHGASLPLLRFAKTGFQLLVFAVPLALLMWLMADGSTLAWLAALVSQAAGLLIERWFFFAQARHPQNIYYQVVS